MGLLEDLQAQSREALLENAEVLYPYTLTFSHPQDNGYTRDVRCSVKALDQLDRRYADRLIAPFPGQSAEFYASLRVMKLHPDDLGENTLPPEGSTADWPSGTLEVLSLSDASVYTGQRTLLCVLRR